MNTENKVARAVDDAMEKARTYKLGYAEVARCAGLDPRTVRGIDAGARVSTLEAIARALGMRLVIHFEPSREEGAV